MKSHQSRAYQLALQKWRWKKARQRLGCQQSGINRSLRDNNNVWIHRYTGQAASTLQNTLDGPQKIHGKGPAELADVFKSEISPQAECARNVIQSLQAQIGRRKSKITGRRVGVSSSKLYGGGFEEIKSRSTTEPVIELTDPLKKTRVVAAQKSSRCAPSRSFKSLLPQESNFPNIPISIAAAQGARALACVRNIPNALLLQRARTRRVLFKYNFRTPPRHDFAARAAGKAR